MMILMRSIAVGVISPVGRAVLPEAGTADSIAGTHGAKPASLRNPKASPSGLRGAPAVTGMTGASSHDGSPPDRDKSLDRWMAPGQIAFPSSEGHTCTDHREWIGVHVPKLRAADALQQWPVLQGQRGLPELRAEDRERGR